MKTQVESAAAAPLDGEPQASDSFIVYPPGFFQRTEGEHAGLWHTEQGKDGEAIETWIGPNLYVLGQTRDNNSESWGLLLGWQDPDGNGHEWAMPKSMLEGDPAEYRKRLADKGWSCSPNPRARNKLAEFLHEVRPQARVLCVPRTGWHKDDSADARRVAYVFPDGTIRKEYGLVQLEQIVLQARTAENPFAKRGSQDDWRERVATLALGNSRVMMALCAALAAPLLYPCGMESGGFNFVGASSTGKTTALLVASSVWGSGSRENGYTESWRNTDNGLESKAVLHSDALLVLDEIGQAPDHTIKEMPYMLGNGRTKGRSQADGTAKKTISFLLIFLSSGEIGLAERIMESGGMAKAGQQVRLLDIPADAGAGMGLFENLHGHADPSAFAATLQREAASAYGTAARAFIRKLVDMGHDAIAKQWRDYRASELEKLAGPKSDGQTKRAAERFLLCMLAGEWAAEWGILPWPQGAATEAVTACFRAWLEHRGGRGPAEDMAIRAQVLRFLEQHGQSRFQDVNDADDKCINRVGFRERFGDSIRYHVLPESFKSEVAKGYPHKHAAKVLKAAGILVTPDPERQLQWLAVPEGLGKIRGYILTVPDSE